MSDVQDGIFHLRSMFDQEPGEFGYRLKQDLVSEEGDFLLTFVDFLEATETTVGATELAERLADCQNLGGWRHLEALLREPAKIAHLQDCYLVAPATTVVSPGGRKFIPYVYWDDGEKVKAWRRGFYSVLVGLCRKFRLIGYIEVGLV